MVKDRGSWLPSSGASDADASTGIARLPHLMRKNIPSGGALVAKIKDKKEQQASKRYSSRISSWRTRPVLSRTKTSINLDLGSEYKDGEKNIQNTTKELLTRRGSIVKEEELHLDNLEKDEEQTWGNMREVLQLYSKLPEKWQSKIDSNQVPTWRLPLMSSVASHVIPLRAAMCLYGSQRLCRTSAGSQLFCYRWFQSIEDCIQMWLRSNSRQNARRSFGAQ